MEYCVFSNLYQAQSSTKTENFLSISRYNLTLSTNLLKTGFVDFLIEFLFLNASSSIIVDFGQMVFKIFDVDPMVELDKTFGNKKNPL